MLRRILLGLLVVVVAAAAAWALWPRPLAVEAAVIGRQSLDVTVEDEGVSRIKDVFTVSAPIGGKLLRLTLQPGDPVAAEKTVVASIQPGQPGLLDARARAIAESNAAAAQSAVEQALAQQQQAKAQLEFARNELARNQTLAGKGIVPEQVYQKAVMDLSVAQNGLGASDANLAVQRQELTTAKAALIENVEDADRADCTDVRAPSSGEVLSVMTQSEQVVAAGTPILTIGDPQNLEIAVDLLSRDAVAVSRGDKAQVINWGGPPLAAVVDHVDPAGVTKVSALGIEEQRVTVVLKLVNAASSAKLGHNFRVVAQISIWQGKDLVAVPVGALFRQGQDWAVFVVDHDRASLHRITLGHQNMSYAEVLAGLKPGDSVILHPGDRVVDGTQVTAGD